MALAARLFKLPFETREFLAQRGEFRFQCVYLPFKSLDARRLAGDVIRRCAADGLRDFRFARKQLDPAFFLLSGTRREIADQWVAALRKAVQSFLDAGDAELFAAFGQIAAELEEIAPVTENRPQPVRERRRRRGT